MTNQGQSVKQQRGVVQGGACSTLISRPPTICNLGIPVAAIQLYFKLYCTVST